jgi:hypothetical protein
MTKLTIEELEDKLKNVAVDIIQHNLYTNLIDLFNYTSVELYNNELTLRVDNECILEYLQNNKEYFQNETLKLYHTICYNDDDVKFGDILYFTYIEPLDVLEYFENELDFENQEDYKDYLVDKIRYGRSL